MVSRKIIKKIGQFAVILLLIVVAIPATGYILLQNTETQTRLAHKVMITVSEKLGTKFSVNSIEIAFLYRVRLNGIYLQDVSGDTLIYSESITAGIKYVNPFKKKVSIGSLTFEKAFLNLAIDSVKGLNLNYFIDKLKGDGKGEGGWEVVFNNMKLRNGRFNLKNQSGRTVKNGINFSDLKLYAIQADLKRFSPKPDSLSFYVKSLQFKEKSGFVLDRFTTEFSQHKTFLCFRNIAFKTKASDVHGKEISLRFAGFDRFKSDSLPGCVNLIVDLQPSTVNISDIGYFAPALYKINESIRFSGKVNGPINNLKGKELKVFTGNHTSYSGDLHFEGLPDIRHTFIIAGIDQMSVTAADLNNLWFLEKKGIILPTVLNKLGVTTYHGNFTGFINDFVAYGSFNTALGFIYTDLLFRPDTSNLLDFQGKIEVDNFDLGELINAHEKIGHISLTASVDGATLDGNSIDATIKGLISQFDFMNYRYTNISLSGDVQNKTFNGAINMHDPNIDLEFLGNVNFTDSVPNFNFTANITDADLYDLNINKESKDFRVSCYIMANAHGSSVNTLNGEVKLLNSLFNKKDKQLQIYDLTVTARNRAEYNNVQLRSDFLDADLKGDFKLSESGKIIRQLVTTYLPALLDSSEKPKDFPNNNIAFSAKIKKINPLFSFFAPGYKLADNSLLDFNYRTVNKEVHFHFESDYIEAGPVVWNKMNVNLEGNPSSLFLEAGSSDLTVSKKVRFDNFTILSDAGQDTAGIQIRWNNWEDVQYKGDIHASARISRNYGQKKPKIDLMLHHSEIVTNDTLWVIQPGQISMDSTAIRFDSISLNHKNEYFGINGSISQRAQDVLEVVFNHFDLGNINSFSATAGNKIDGILNGKATLSHLYSNPLFTSQLTIDSLILNNEMLGSTEINSSWDDSRKAISVNAIALRNNLKTIDIRGEYFPSGQGRFDFELELEKLRLNLFNPYVKSIFTDLRGIASGKINLTGSLNKPMINGKLNLQKTNFTVNYLKTRYNFSDQVEIENNNIYFSDIRVYDAKGNSAYLNGNIRNRYLKDFLLDLNIRSENFLCLNTNQADNKQFYGTAYATGSVRIAGPLKNLTMDITATTDPNTSVKIPLSNTGELNEYPFISVIDSNEDNEETIEVKEYRAGSSGLQIRCRLIVTPDAEVQIIIDPQLGEIIKGKGSGNLDMRISSGGDFVMTGEYTIDEGEYLLTLQKYINKRLTIESGGSIRWDGDPLDATIDIVANYGVKANIGDLFGNGEDTRIQVNDRVILTGKLMSPDIKYDIYLPDADESTRLRVNGAMTTSEEKSRQFISILMTNRFSLNPQYAGNTSATSASPYSSAAGVNLSEMLSNQLSNWLSQLVNDLDVDFNYRSNRELRSEEVQLAFSYPLINDRLIVNGSFQTNAAKNQADEIVGEFDIDYRLKPNGKLWVKTYNHANNDVLYEDKSTYTQGLGLSYKQEFDTLGELLRRLFGKKEDKPEPETKNRNKEAVIPENISTTEP